MTQMCCDKEYDIGFTNGQAAINPGLFICDKLPVWKLRPDFLNPDRMSTNYYTMASLTGVDTVVSSKYGISYIAAKPFENCFS